MKFFTKPLSLFILSTVFLASVDYGQSIKIIPNPSTSDYGFFGSPFNYGSNLYFQYQNSSYLSQLAKYDGTTISLIPNFQHQMGDFRVIPSFMVIICISSIKIHPANFNWQNMMAPQ